MIGERHDKAPLVRTSLKNAKRKRRKFVMGRTERWQSAQDMFPGSNVATNYLLIVKILRLNRGCPFITLIFLNIHCHDFGITVFIFSLPLLEKDTFYFSTFNIFNFLKKISMRNLQKN